MRFGICTVSVSSVEPRVSVSGGLKFPGQLLPGNRTCGQADFPQEIKVDG